MTAAEVFFQLPDSSEVCANMRANIPAPSSCRTHMLCSPAVWQSTYVESVRVRWLARSFSAICLNWSIAAVDAEHAGVDCWVGGGRAQQDAPIWVVLAGTAHLQDNRQCRNFMVLQDGACSKRRLPYSYCQGFNNSLNRPTP